MKWRKVSASRHVLAWSSVVFVGSLLLGMAAAGGVAAPTRPAQTKLTVRMDFFAGPEQAGFWVAKAKGWYAQNGLDVQVLEGQGSDSTAQLVAAGRDTAGYVSADALLRANSKGANLVMVAMPIQDAGWAIVTRANSRIRRPKDLEGRTYGDSAGSATVPLLFAFCAATKVDCKNIKIVYVPTSAVIPGFFSGKFDAIQANDWWPSGYTKKGPVRFIKFRNYGVSTQGWGIVFDREMLASDPEVVRKFVRATMKGFAWAFQNPRAVHALIKKEVKIDYYDQKADLDALKLFVKRTPNAKGKPLGWMSIKDWQRTISILKRYGGLKNPPAANSVFTNRFVGR